MPGLGVVPQQNHPFLSRNSLYPLKLFHIAQVTLFFLALLPFCVAMFSTTDLWEGILWMKLKFVARVAMSPSNC